MAEPSALTRWLPTMLGALVAVGVVVAYELDFIERKPTVTGDCPSAPETAVVAERPRNPFIAGAAAPSRRADKQLDAPLEDRVAILETQNALLAERHVTGEMGYYNLSQAELEAMARHCDVRTDYPKNLDPQETEDLGLEPAEREAWGRALQKFADQELEQYRALLAEVDPDTPDLDSMSLAEVRRRLLKVVGRARVADDDSLQRHVAEERAGLREPPDDPASLSAFNRYNRLRFNAGDRFAELLGEELGEDRMHELRSVFEGWPGARTRQWGCPGENKN